MSGQTQATLGYTYNGKQNTNPFNKDITFKEMQRFQNKLDTADIMSNNSKHFFKFGQVKSNNQEIAAV